MNEGHNYYSKPRNFAACIKKSDATEEVFIYLCSGKYQSLVNIKQSYQVLASQQVSWCEPLAIPVIQTIMVIETN